MKPVISSNKRSSSFTIESLIGNDTETSSSSSFQSDDMFRRHLLRNMDTGSRVPPTHPELLGPLNRFYHDQITNAHTLALRSWGLHASSLGAATTMGPGQYALAGHASMNPVFVNRTLEHQQLYPWLLGRHGHCVSYAIPGYTDPGLLFHPYRKPKRIRTAFSPTQLIKLDLAFDRNHYVVGDERKELASKLGLTETQVKVWFQNRRTKYKRVNAEDESGKPSGFCNQLERRDNETGESVDSGNRDEDDTIDVL